MSGETIFGHLRGLFAKGFLYGLGFWTAAVVVITLWGVVLP